MSDTDLEKRLRELELEFLHGVPVHLTDEMIAQIKQAFADEGYMDNKFSVWTPDKKQEPQTPEQKAYSDKIFKDAVPFMTGAEWYERFKDEVRQTVHKAQSKDTMYLEQDEVYEAAKRAAGVE